MDPTLQRIVERLPDADAARWFYSRLQADQPERLERLHRAPPLLANLLTVAAFSPWLGDALLGDPDAIDWLGSEGNLARSCSKEAYVEELAGFARRGSHVDEQSLLAAFKYRELARIFLRDCLNLATLTETVEELSHLADALLERALARTYGEFVDRHGVPMTADAHGRATEAQFVVVGLGKLGSLELNYASDIDLMFLYSGTGATAATERREPAAPLDNHTFFNRLAAALVKLVGTAGRAPAVFRVDLRLRPFGREGDLSVRVDRAVDYYRRQARIWEHQMLLRARASAGSAALMDRFLDEVRDLIFRPEPLPGLLGEVRSAREKIDRAELARGGGFNVKLGPGGIREVEFIVQALQLAHGGRDTWVRTPRVLVGLQRLADRGLVGDSDRGVLSDAYHFLRTVEHRLQMQHGVQTQRLPTDAASLALLARRCGFDPRRGDPASQLRAELARHTPRVRAIYERVLVPTPPAAKVPPFPTAWSADEAAEAQHPLGAAARRLAALDSHGAGGGFAEHDGASSTRSLVAGIASRVRYPARTLRDFDRFLASLATREDFGRPEWSLASEPERLDQVMRLLASGAFVADMLASQPALALRVPGPLFCAVPRTQQELFESLVGALRDAGTFGARIAALRRAWYGEMVAIVAHDVLGGGSLAEIHREQTHLAEAALGAACWVAFDELLPEDDRTDSGLAFSLQALGPFGRARMDYGSALNLVLVYDDDAPSPSASLEPARVYARLAELLVRILSSLTSKGHLYRVEMPALPGGSGRGRATSLGRLIAYLRAEASAPELCAMLEARPIVGSVEFGDLVREEIVRTAFEQCDRSDALAEELRGTLRWHAREGHAASLAWDPRDLADIDRVARFVQLRARVDFAPGLGTTALIQHLGTVGALAPEAATDLAAGYDLLQRLDHQRRLVGDPGAPWARETLASAVGYEGAAALDADLEEVRRRVWAVCDSLV
jgi:[glutamine synthetase] adenylyltransferase / [glutamine synthetase]-adenylyl-L-tyrosine phosphorylase